MVEGISFSDAETRIHKLFEEEHKSKEFVVTNIQKTNISEVINYEDRDGFFKTKISMLTIDEEARKEKRINEYMLVSADSVSEAIMRTEDSLSGILLPMEISSVAVANIAGVYPIELEVQPQID